MPFKSHQPLTVRWTIAAGLFLGTLLFVGTTLRGYGITWDEPPYFHASELHIAWIIDFAKNFVQGNINDSLADENINAAWHWDPYHVPHPPFSRVVSGITRALTSPWLDKFSGYRIAPALFFAVLVTVMFLWIGDLFGRATGLFSALTLLVTPNLFGFAHIAVTDMPLTSMWFLTAYCFWKGLINWKWSVATGVAWGLALATKFPALLIPVPLILWAHWFRRDKYVNNVFAMIFLAPVVILATEPYLWHQPGPRILEFLHEGINRAYRPDTNFMIYFFDELYFTSQLPRYYPFFAVAVTTPEPILALALLGVASIPWLQARRAATALFLANGAFVLIMGILPGAVLHDGVRQLLPALPFLSALAGAGFFFLARCLVNVAQRCSRLTQIANVKAKISATLFLLACFNPALELYLCHPYQLSYYNRLVGGIRGAYERGLETTYFMEAFTPNFLTTLNENLPQNATINASFANFMFSYYQQEGRLRRDIRITDGRPFDYYLLLNRRSLLSPSERQLMNSLVRPYLSVAVAGVPLVLVWDFKNPG
jgi:4-amino-4-deoxy-L-arabinose transferase-like glycosyltransferase